jgi:hypothetical protein
VRTTAPTDLNYFRSLFSRPLPDGFNHVFPFDEIKTQLRALELERDRLEARANQLETSAKELDDEISQIYELIRTDYLFPNKVEPSTPPSAAQYRMGDAQ